jgi:hypothetical protein
METTKIYDYTIEHYGNVPRGLEYLRNNWDTEEVKEIFRNSRAEADQNVHFSANIDGSIEHYILTHTGDYVYRLEPNN